jgi:hypothetical protein
LKEVSAMTTAADAGAPDWRGRIGKMGASDLAHFLSQGGWHPRYLEREGISPQDGKQR